METYKKTYPEFRIVFEHEVGDDFIEEKYLIASDKLMEIPENSLLAILDRALKKNGIIPGYKEELLVSLNGSFHDILIFLNEKEPGKGKTSLLKVTPKKGDKISVALIN